MEKALDALLLQIPENGEPTGLRGNIICEQKI